MIKSLLLVLFATSLPSLGDTLVSGTIYFDSEHTLKEVVELSSRKDNEGIAHLIANGHVSSKTTTETDIVVILYGSTPESSAEFRFLNNPTTYWTLTKYISGYIQSTPAPTPEPTPIHPATITEKYDDAGVTEEKPVSPPPKRPRPHHVPNDSDPTDTDEGRRIWHKVNGLWKWYPADKFHKKAPEKVPRTLPVTPQ
jgi:hypothetical protein